LCRLADFLLGYFVYTSGMSVPHAKTLPKIFDPARTQRALDCKSKPMPSLH
jgi:hypothetical protein